MVEAMLLNVVLNKYCEKWRVQMQTFMKKRIALRIKNPLWTKIGDSTL